MSGTINFPTNPTVGQLYTFNNTTWQWNGTQWVNATTGTAFMPVAGGTFTGPVTLQGNAATALQPVPLQQVGALSGDNIGRNYLHNALFNVTQRGPGPWTTISANTADRWIMGFVGGSLSTTINAMNDTNRAQIGDEAATQSLVGVCVGSAGANDEAYFEQRIEWVRRLAGKTVTLSFYALASSGAPRVGSFIYQSFGTGGSPVVSVPGTSVAISTVYIRYSVTFSVPSVAGKTLGAAGNDYTGIRLVMSAGATTGASYGNPGVQSNTFLFWGTQLEIGSGAGFPTPLEKLDPQQDVAKCLRFYQVGNVFMAGYQLGGGQFGASAGFMGIMRNSPTITLSTPAGTNVTIAPAQIGPYGFVATGNLVATGGATYNSNYLASADL